MSISLRSILEFAGCDLPVDNPELDQSLPEDSLAACAYRTPGLLCPDEQKKWPDLILSGVPGCGKTQLALALIIAAALKGGSTIFLATPTRPLAQENFDRLRSLCRGLLPEESIVISTGDLFMDDWRIYKGQVRICCTIFEKLLAMLIQNNRINNSNSLVVVDETHMFNQPERGVKLDMLLTALIRDEKRARLVLLTVADEASCELLGRRLGQNGLSPLHLAGRARPQHVEHSLIVHGYEDELCKKPFRRSVLLYDFKNDEPFCLNDATLEQMEKNVVSEIEQADSICQQAFPVDVDFVDELSKKFPHLLVVNTNIDLLHRAAMILCKRRAENMSADAVAVFVQRIDKLLHEDAISSSLRDALVNLATHGVFIHTGKLHKEVRRAVEEVFRNTGGKRYVLFATTTLAYGVNLSLDAVAMSMKLVNLEGKPVIDGVEFHNIMGRAGRFNDCRGAAIVLVSANRNRPFGELVQLNQALCDCYRPQALRVRDPNPLVAEVTAENTDQHSLFLYALMLAAPVSNGEMIPLRRIAMVLRNSVHALAAGIDRAELVKHTQHALDSMAELSCLDIRLLEREQARGEQPQYRITPAGTALLESGGSFADARAMGAFLKLIQGRFSKDERVHIPLIWMSVLLSISAVQNDIDHIFGKNNSPKLNAEPFRAMLIKRIREQGFSEPQAQDFYVRFREVVRIQTRRLSCIKIIMFGGCDDVERNVDRVLSGEFDAADNEFLFPEPEELRRQSEECESRCLHVMLALWEWTRGVDLLNVERAMGLKDNGIRFFPPRMVERLAWRTLLLANFFGGSSFLSAEEMGSVVSLGRRLRTGLRDQQIPCLGRDISRYAIVHSSQATPEEREKMRIVRQDYYHNQALSFCSWVRSIGDATSADLAEQALDDLLSSEESEHAIYFSLLEQIWPYKNWHSVRSNGGDNYTFLWACLALAVLFRHEILPDTVVGEILPASVDDILPLLDRQRVPPRFFSELVAVDTPHVIRRRLPVD